MTREEFDVLVQQIERGLGQEPRSLRSKIAFLALTGYLGLLAGLVAVLLFAAFFFVAAFKNPENAVPLCILGGFVLLLGGWAVLRVLWVRLPPPEGRAINRAETPELYFLLDELQTKLRSIPFHRVLVVPECNAAVVQVPRLGVLGWPKNYLLLGLPLLDGLSLEEFRAVLAHEFAHLSREHGRFSHWVYRLRRTWEKIFEQLSRPQMEGQISLRPLVVKFVNWFWPRFNAHAFVLSRTNEYEADAVAAQLAGPQNCASALFRMALYNRRLNEKFWPDLWQLANQTATPPNDAFVRLRDALAEKDIPENNKWKEEAFRLVTSNADTHPCLSDRLRALGQLPDGVMAGQFPPLPSAPRPSAAEKLFGPALEKIRADVAQNWRKGSEPHWRDRHAKAVSLQHRLTTIDKAVANPAANVDSLWDKARVVLELETDESAEPLFRQIISLDPSHVPSNFHLGRLLLNRGDETGKTHLERVVAEEEDSLPQVCELLYVHYRRTGQTERLRDLDARMDRYERNLAAARAERNSVTAADPLIPHELSELELTALRNLLAAENELTTAHLGRKELRHSPRQRLFLLCVRVRRSWHGLPNRDREQALVNRLSRSVVLPGRVFVFAPSGSFRPLARKLNRLPGAPIFQRDR